LTGICVERVQSTLPSLYQIIADQHRNTINSLEILKHQTAN